MENQMHQMFKHLGFTTTTANAIIQDQGIDSLERFTYSGPLMLRPFARLSAVILVVLSGVGIKMCQTPVFPSQLLLNLT